MGSCNFGYTDSRQIISDYMQLRYKWLLKKQFINIKGLRIELPDVKSYGIAYVHNAGVLEARKYLVNTVSQLKKHLNKKSFPN